MKRPYQVKISSDSGITVQQLDYECSSGSYIGGDNPIGNAPANVFVGRNFSEAKYKALEEYEGLRDQLNDIIYDLRDLRLKDTLR